MFAPGNSNEKLIGICIQFIELILFNIIEVGLFEVF